MLEEGRLTSEALVANVASLFRDGDGLERMSVAARMLAHPQAALEIAAMAARLAGVK